MRRQSRQNRRQRQRTPAETIKGRTDSGNPGTNGLFEPDRKTPGSAGLGGGGCKPSETGLQRLSRCYQGKERGISRIVSVVPLLEGKNPCAAVTSGTGPHRD